MNLRAIVRDVAPTAALVGVMAMAWCGYRHDLLEDGRREQRLHELEAKDKTAALREESLQRAFRWLAQQHRVDSVRTVKWRERVETKIVPVWTARPDHEMVSVGEVKRELLFPIDSAVGSCLLTWGRCEELRLNAEERAENAESRLRSRTAERDEWRAKAEPSLWSQLRRAGQTGVVVGTIAFGACYVASQVRP